MSDQRIAAMVRGHSKSDLQNEMLQLKLLELQQLSTFVLNWGDNYSDYLHGHKVEFQRKLQKDKTAERQHYIKSTYSSTPSAKKRAQLRAKRKKRK